MAFACTINDVPDVVLHQILAGSDQDFPALVPVNRRFNNIFVPKLYEKISYLFASSVQYQMPVSEHDLQQMVMPQIIHRMQDFLRAIFTTPGLAWPVKELRLQSRRLIGAIQWLATRKHDAAIAPIRRVLESARDQGSNGIAFILRTLPSRERLHIDRITRFFRDVRTQA